MTTRDRGEANALGLVLIAPVAIGVALLVLWIGRKVDTDAQVQAASSAAAQAAARQRTPSAAAASARATAAAMLTDAKACAGGASVEVDTAQFHPGGVVNVTVRCSPSRSDLSPLQPASATFTASASATVDPYRAGPLP
jgi:Flp pilus assembly protein TadG